MSPLAQPETRLVSKSGTSNGILLADKATSAHRLPPRPSAAPSAARAAANDSLFDRFAWLYVFFREKVFRDDTDRIANALWPEGSPAPGAELLELGCGPGFYSCGLAARFPTISVLGVDCSAQQLTCAKRKALSLQLKNCVFERDNVLELTHGDESVDAVIAARLFTVLPNRERAIAEMFRVLRPGGRCVIAEPRYAFWASLPLFAMWVIASLTCVNNGYREPAKATVLAPSEFKRLFATQPWQRVSTWCDGRYQYALCEKG
ncbi:MAG: methyltransferase domain-containing protein [Chthoniobacterales bacterium]|nr:methyltransferase domain-containing protein [Chthoniobacterales bacterium]